MALFRNLDQWFSWCFVQRSRGSVGGPVWSGPDWWASAGPVVVQWWSSGGLVPPCLPCGCALSDSVCMCLHVFACVCMSWLVCLCVASGLLHRAICVCPLSVACVGCLFVPLCCLCVRMLFASLSSICVCVLCLPRVLCFFVLAVLLFQVCLSLRVCFALLCAPSVPPYVAPCVPCVYTVLGSRLLRVFFCF